MNRFGRFPGRTSNGQALPTLVSTSAPDAAAALRDALVRVADGDRVAFETVYRRTSAKLFGVCLRILVERPIAEDVLQEAYLTIWRRAGSFDPARGSAVAWLATVARNCAVDRLRATKPIASAPIELAEAVPDTAPLISETLVEGEDAARLELCLGTLAQGDATLIRTAFFEGSSYPELASRTASPLGTIKSRIRRALIKLRECLR